MILKKYSLISLLLFFVFTQVFIFPQKAEACSCVMPLPPLEAMEYSEAVFYGTVVDVVQNSSERNIQVTFNINKSWKGLSSEKTQILVKTAMDSAACGFNFEEGKTYLVYSFGKVDDKSFGVNLCSRTHEATMDDEDILLLGEGVTHNYVESFENGELEIDDEENLLITLGSLIIITLIIWAIIVLVKRK